MRHATDRRRLSFGLFPGLLLGLLLAVPLGAQESDEPPPTLGLEQGTLAVESPELRLELVRASQTVAALRPRDSLTFSFTPTDRLESRAGNGHYHLGDLNLRLRPVGSPQWREVSTATDRRPVRPLDISGPALAAADLGPTLPADLPLDVRRFWEVEDGELVLRFELHNRSGAPVEIGALGVPMVFNNILSERSLEEAHRVSSFHDPYIGNDAGYVQVTRLSGAGPALVVAPLPGTPLEAWRPLLDEETPRSITFEGFYEWMPHSVAYAEEEWAEATPWNPPTSAVLEPGETRSWGVRFLVAPSIREIEETLLAAGQPVAVGVPGYVLPTDLDGRLFLRHDAAVRGIAVEPAGALTLEPTAPTPGGWPAYDVVGHEPGRARVTVSFEDGLEQTLHYKVIAPLPAVVDSLGAFLTSEQWYDVPDPIFGRSPAPISYDYGVRRPVTEERRAWIAGLSDEGGAGSWLAAVMKQLVRPDARQVRMLETFVGSVLWGGIQYDEGARKYAVRKSLFFYEPDEVPEGTYSDSIGYGGWSSWDREEAESVGRSYNYPHVAAAHWVLYRLARNHEGLVTSHGWDWYLERAYQTGQAMVRHAPHYAQFGQMEGTVFVLILQDLKREGWTEEAEALESSMRDRAEVWRDLAYPFGSEMPWDSTGQEEVYAWSRYFGFDAKAEITLNAILGYMPTVPHWGYNGSARRYWDFLFAGKLTRIERQLHHYGSALNAIPVLAEYRRTPDDLYLLRVGYGGLLGGVANITGDGFGPAAFHAFPSTLRIDHYSGDYGSGFFGHAINTGSYLVRDPELGWLAFGGTLERRPSERDGAGAGAERIRLEPRDAARSRVFLAPLGLWLVLDAGTFEAVELEGDAVRVTLAPADAHTPVARLRLESTPGADGAAWAPVPDHARERGAWRVPLSPAPTTVEIRATDRAD